MCDQVPGEVGGAYLARHTHEHPGYSKRMKKSIVYDRVSKVPQSQNKDHTWSTQELGNKLCYTDFRNP